MEFYGQLLLEYFDGVDINYRMGLGRGTLDWRVGGGQFKTHSSYAGPLTIHSDYSPTWLTTLQYQNFSWSWRLGYMHAKLDDAVVDGQLGILRSLGSYITQIPPDLVQASVNTNQTGDTINQVLLAFAWEDGPWIVQSELSSMKYLRQFTAGYLSVGYNLDAFTPYFMMGRLYVEPRPLPDSAHHLTEEQERRIGHLVNVVRTSSSQTAFSIGARWDALPWLAIKAQWDHRRVRDNHVYLWREQPGEDHDKAVNTFSVVADFIF